MSFVSWLYDNREWLFPGVGATVAAGALRIFSRARKNRNPAPSEMATILDMRRPGTSEPSSFWLTLAVLPWIKGTAWKRIYTAERLEDRIRISVTGEGEGVVIHKYGDHGQLTLHLQVVNFCPFPITVDRFTGNLSVAHALVSQIKMIDPERIEPSSMGRLIFRTELGAQNIRNVSEQPAARYATARLNLNIYIETFSGRFTLQKELETGNCRLVNF